MRAALGAEIDAHDAVLRVNEAPIWANLSDRIGAKTTWYIDSFAAWRNAYGGGVRESEVIESLVICDRPFLNECHRALIDHPHAHAINPLFYFDIRQHAGYSRIPLTGLLAVAVAMRSCDRVDVYGFSGFAPRADLGACA